MILFYLRKKRALFPIICLALYFCFSFASGIVSGEPPFLYTVPFESSIPDPFGQIFELGIRTWGFDYFADYFTAMLSKPDILLEPIPVLLVTSIVIPFYMLVGLIISLFLLGLRRSVHSTRA